LRFRLPSTRFHRSIGIWAGVATDPEGRPITDEEWHLRQHDWLPSPEDRGFVASLMRRVTEPGKVAGWMAPPEIGINNTPRGFAYVRLN
jgi:benzoyl-CoA 2,3-dioxygenase component B